MIFTKKITTKNTLQYYKLYVNYYCLINSIKLADKMAEVLAIFIIKGITKEAYDFIINKEIANKNTINVYKTYLVANGLIIKLKSNNWVVKKELQTKERENTFNWTILKE